MWTVDESISLPATHHDVSLFYSLTLYKLVKRKPCIFLCQVGSHKRGEFTFINKLDYALPSEGIINNILDFKAGVHVISTCY